MARSELRPLLLGVIAALLLVKYAETANMLARRVKYVNVTTRFSPKHLSNIVAWVERDTMNIDWYVVRDFTTGLHCMIDIQLKLADAKKYQTLLTYDYDVCKVLHEMFHESLLKTWFRNLLKYSNFTQNCPVQAGHYYMHNMTLEAGSIPVYLRSGQYIFASYCYYGKRKSKREDFVMELIPELKIL